jgi:hypothetical protein
MRQYRIKQISDNQYISQTRKLMDVLLFWDSDWYSITDELQEVEDVDGWMLSLIVITTMEQAEERIKQFKLKQIKQQYPKYYSSK